MSRSGSITKALGCAALASLLALGAAACGGDDSSSGKDAKTTAAGGGTMAKTDAGDSAGDSAAITPAGTPLKGVVGPGFEIHLTDDKGGPVSKLAAGEYTIEVDDQSDAHNFHLTGEGVDETTEVGSTGKQTWKVKFASGEYKYVCDPHASQMNGAITVT